MKLSIRTRMYGLIGLVCAVGAAQAGASLWFATQEAPAQQSVSTDGSRGAHEAMLREIIAWLGLVSVLATGAAGIYLLRRQVLVPLQNLRESIASLPAGRGAMLAANSPPGDEFGAMALDLAALREALAPALRAQSALANSGFALMITDPDLTITEANARCVALLQASATEIRKRLPDFDPERPIGQSIAGLFPDRTAWAAVGSGQMITLQLGKCEFQLNAWLITDPALAPTRQTRAGYGLHWQDVSAQTAAEMEITGLIQGLGAGEFSGPLALVGKSGFSRALAQELNHASARIRAALQETGETLAALGQQDFTRRVTGEYSGAFEALKHHVNAVSDGLTGIVASLQDNAAKLRTATREIQAGASDLADRTTHQASTLEETSAATEELARSVADNAARAEQARISAASAQANADHSAQVARNATEAMGQIVQSSQRISEIISLIDDIAFQTNLLALNASVEAARAGDAGKGFAVVASEVRRLAQSAAQASAEVKTLIQTSSQSVRAGVDLVDRSGLSLRKIEADVRDLSGLMQAIALASREQAHGLEQVHVAVKQMDQITQKNAALAQETSAAIEQSESQARDLDATLGGLRITRAPGGASLLKPSRPPAPPQAAPRPPSPARDLQTRVRRSVSTAASPAATLGMPTTRAEDDWSEF